MNDQELSQEESAAAKDLEQPAPDDASGEGEFKVTVRKLELPVRPRGVLAE